MSMRLVSEFLLKNEINKYKNKDKLEPCEKIANSSRLVRPFQN